MEDGVLHSFERRSPDHRFTIPKRPRKAPVPPITSPRMSTPRLVGQEELHRPNENERVPGHNRNSEGPCESPAVASIDDTTEQTDKLPRPARHIEQASLSADRERCTPERLLVWNSSGQLSKHPDGEGEEEGDPSLSPEEGGLSLPADSSACVQREHQGCPPRDALLPIGVVNGDGYPESMLVEAGEQDRHMSPGIAVQQEDRSSTHVPPREYTSRPIDWGMEDTWRIPVEGGNAARQSLFKSVLSWLIGK